MTVAELAYEQIKTLPENQAREVLDFIGYLKEKRASIKIPATWARRVRSQAILA
ncbi:DUF2281 domain-containing protein [uncultured Lamprocystis sp.]|jgi:hypothetical protein|uniref:DUF2281 domain-containing protein n=1 Tax=uncultured Lamprocystis sp. TaxID=543132 RepID=UPI0025E03DF6|nr:DUF2281 domain-containing protein [uncultured Lamprocystis sp.]